MKDLKTYTMDDAMRDVSALKEYFERYASYSPGGPCSETARQMRNYAQALRMVMEKVKTEHYHIE